MSRNVCAVMAGWLAAASVGLAQSGQPNNAPPAGQARPLSPYFATASTVDRSGGEESQAPPDMMPNMPIPRAPAAPPMASGPGMALPPGGSCGPNGCGAAPCTTCAPGCNPCGPNGPCGPAGRMWGSAEYLLWWTRGMHLPPLVTTSPVGTPRGAAGVLGDARTTILAGDDNVNNDLRSGVRFRSGFWLDECQTCGLDGSVFYLAPQSTHDTFNCFTNPILARPFFNASTPAGGAALVNIPRPDAELVCLPGVITGSVTVDTKTTFWGGDTNIRKNICCGCDARLDVLLGYRYLRLTDEVTITENLSAVDPNNPTIPVGTAFLVQDDFRSKNEFNGGQVGLVGEVRRGRWYVTGRGVVALGSTHSEIDINGTTTITVPGAAPAVNVGGLLALPTNIGHYTNNEFAVVPEGSLTVGYQLTDGIRAFVGYTFLYWSNVSRAGDQIDLVVNTSQIPPGTLTGAFRPAFQRHDTDFWAQGVSFGLELRY